MTRKDTILIAVIINAGLLSILFITAVIYDTDKTTELNEFVSAPINKSQSDNPIDSIALATGDEIDNVLKYYNSPTGPQSINLAIEDNFNIEPTPIPSKNSSVIEDSHPPLATNEQFIEVKVKKGDVLEKIARANKSSVEEIKKINQIDGERLSIGQVLKIPVKQVVATNDKKIEQPRDSESVYYVVKSGDSPWKIAKQFNVTSEDILRLNNIDEEKARNLKIGDRIRVK